MPSPVSKNNEQLESLEGVIERITFRAEDTGYTVARLQVEGLADTVAVVGTFNDITPGEAVLLFGGWRTHPKYGRQFEFTRYQIKLPATAEGITKYLGSGLIRGIGPKTAKALVSQFGAATLEVIEQEPGRLKEVPGVGAKKAASIAQAWKDQHEVRNIMVFLQGHGVSAAYAVRIFRTYGDRAIEVVRSNPYRLAQDVWGIGFKTADAIARSLGIGPDAPERIEAGILHALEQSAEAGHVYLPDEELVSGAAGLLDADVGAVWPALKQLRADNRLAQEGECVYLPGLFNIEVSSARLLAELTEFPVPRKPTREQVLAWLVLQGNGLELSADQGEAIVRALTEKVTLITGGPGTGKTTITGIIVKACRMMKKKILLASPTGLAAKRLMEATDHEAKTLHRLLEFEPQSMTFKRDENNPLEADVVLVDEASMLELRLFHSLLRALSAWSQLILVGDADQLPSVGAGTVLKDLIQSEKVPVVRLTEIFRQARASLIVRNAHQINHGQFPELPKPDSGEDCVFLEAQEHEKALDLIRRVVTLSLPKRGFSTQDIQVISPMHRGTLGVTILNQTLQQDLNPPSPDKPEVNRGVTFRSGDRVLQTRNNYPKEVFNGDIGTVTDVDHENQTLRVAFPELEVNYDFSELDELQLAYALSIHKSQGSEYPAVVVVVHSTHYIMLQRNLLYTALTRAKRMAVLVGNRKGIALCVHNNREALRYSRLRERLIGFLRS